MTRRQPPRAGRAEILRTMTPHLLDVGAERPVFEAQVGQDDLDRQVIFEVLGKPGKAHAITYSHVAPRLEPMLWLPDAIGWVYGKSGDWRQGVSRQIEHVGRVP